MLLMHGSSSTRRTDRRRRTTTVRVCAITTTTTIPSTSVTLLLQLLLVVIVVLGRQSLSEFLSEFFPVQRRTVSIDKRRLEFCGGVGRSFCSLHSLVRSRTRVCRER